jgi:hypothetical protein
MCDLQELAARVLFSIEGKMQRLRRKFTGREKQQIQKRVWKVSFIAT